MARILRSPGKYVQGPGVLAEAHLYLKDLGDRVCFLASPRGVDRIRPQVEASMTANGMTARFEIAGNHCTRQEVRRLCQRTEETGCTVVAGVGGGSILDLAKAVSYYTGLPLAVLPTVASCDAPTSALSVLYTEDGTFDQYLFLPRSPDLVMVDTRQVANAPARLLAAGIGDAMATWFEARAVQRSGRNNQVQGKPTLAAQALARRCYETLLADGVQAMRSVEEKVCSAALENIVEANTYLSGIGFESGGLGAAHAMQKGFTTIPGTHAYYHGEVVAFGTLVQLVLENAPAEEVEPVVRFFRQVGLPVTLAQIGAGNASREQLLEAARFAVRPGMTIHNMPFEVTEESVLAAILVADRMGRELSRP